MKRQAAVHLAPSTSGQSLSWFWFFLPFALAGLGVAAFVIIQPITVLPRITLAPGFRLMNEIGLRVSNEELRGQVILYSFSYTACDEACGQSATQIAAVRQALNGRSPIPLHFITISLQPERDTPEQLQTFVTTFANEATTIRWQWLTGDVHQVRAAVGSGFDLYYAAQPDGSVKFRPRYILVDSNGMIRARYFTAEPEAELLLRDMNYLAQEGPNSE